MKIPAFAMRRTPAAIAVGLLLALTLLALHPPVAQMAQETEPTPRITPTPAPYLQLEPVEGPAGTRNRVVATGGLWVPGGSVVLYWDSTDRRIGNAPVNPDGTFQTT
ncbi:MAG TPA: hypothetical protein VLC52_05070, partial [Anaerolineae bacterium]|nr:hypothetical protein [Anaerolineae bacterium]